MINDSGVINGHIIGIVLKELVRRAIVVIRNERHAFEVQRKMSYGGKMDDVLTSADTKAQEVYLRSIRECFPNFGVVGEEDSLNIPGKEPDTYITIDPLDGTKAFVRRQSHGVGTMIGLVGGGEVVSAYIGDINTQEIFGFRPESNKVHRIGEFNNSEILKPQTDKPLGERYAMLRNSERSYSELSQATIEKNFKGVIIDGGSIGTWLARLWKNEVAGAFIEVSWETPWDLTPIYGISKKLGYVFLMPNSEGKNWQEYVPELKREKYKRDHEVLVIHSDYRDKINI